MHFPVAMKRLPDGKVILKNVADEDFLVYDKEGGILSETQYSQMILDNDGFWTIAKKHKLVPVCTGQEKV